MACLRPIDFVLLSLAVVPRCWAATPIDVLGVLGACPISGGEAGRCFPAGGDARKVLFEELRSRSHVRGWHQATGHH